MMIYSGKTGIKYKLEKQLGSGGEGSVYTIAGHSDKVAKIYKAERFHSTHDRTTMDRKLQAMLAMKIPAPADGIIRLAWPQDILYDNGRMVGFVMPWIKSQYKMHDICRTGRNPVKEKIFPDYTWKYSVQFAYHFAWVVSFLHQRNIIIGDFNPNNFVVDNINKTIVLIDCDSYDITNPVTGEHFPCPVAFPEYLAPELQDVGLLSNGRFTKESDDFSLAIHIFRLLMNNADPFGGILTSGASVSNIPVNHAILNGECAYIRKIHGKKIPDWSPGIEILPNNIQHLFRKTFDYNALSVRKKMGSRATAMEWCNALGPLGAAEPNYLLSTCPREKLHVYPVHNNSCPWCALNTSNTQRNNQKKQSNTQPGNPVHKQNTSGMNVNLSKSTVRNLQKNSGVNGSNQNNIRNTSQLGSYYTYRRKKKRRILRILFTIILSIMIAGSLLFGAGGLYRYFLENNEILDEPVSVTENGAESDKEDETYFISEEIKEEYPQYYWNFNSSLGETLHDDPVIIVGDTQIVPVNDSAVLQENAAYFDGNGDYIEYGHGLNLTPTYTFNIMLKCEDVNKSYSAFFAKYERSMQGPYAFSINQGRINCWITNEDATGHEEVESSQILENDTWYFISIVREINKLSIYVNGILDTESTISSWGEGEDTITIGRQALMFEPEDQLQYTGYIGMISIYDTNLSAGQIMQLAKEHMNIDFTEQENQTEESIYKSDNQRYWIIFQEGTRNNRIEMSTVDSDVSPENLSITWNGGLKLTDTGGMSRCNQYYLNEQGEWEFLWDYGTLSDCASNVIASNLDVYDGNGSLILNKCNYDDVDWNALKND